MAMRLSGLMSGMDTESIVQELVAVKQVKVDELKKEQTKLEWKQEIWKELNTKIKKLYNGTLSNLRYQGSYAKKVTKVSDSSVADVIAGDNSMDSVQTLRVKKLAHSGYLTGAEIVKADGEKCTSGTLLKDMGIEVGSKFSITTKGKTTEIEVTEDMTIGNLTKKLNEAGVKANFDSKTQRIFIGSAESGAAADFKLTGADEKGINALGKLGLLVYDDALKKQYNTYADMETDAAAYQSELDARVAARLEKIKAQLTAGKDKMQSVVDAYNETKGTDEPELVDLVNGVDGKLTALQEEKAELEAKETLTEEEAARLNEIKGTLSFVDGYKAAQQEVDALAAYYSEDPNTGEITASAQLIGEEDVDLQTAIAEAKSAIANWDKLVEKSGATKVDGTDAEIYLNGARFTNSTNSFEINGLTITCNAETGDKEVTLTTQNDVSGVYDMIKNFITEYSTLINEMDKLYNADSAKGYEPLTEDEKYEMSENEIEKWEEKIKDSLLRKDATLSSVSSAFKDIMSSGFSVNGQTMYLSNFGIETLGYFEAPDNERNAYHIDGDEDDEYVGTETNTLKAMISSDPDAVINFFSQLSKKMYEKTTDLMKSVQDYSSSYTVYEDKKMQSDYDDYTEKIKELEEKLADYEDKWYSKFAAMETAMAKMQSNASAITGLLGGS